MFDFEKIDVYKRAFTFNRDIYHLINQEKNLLPYMKDQLGRAALSVLLNIAEGNSRYSKADKRRFFIISRGSTFECASILSLLAAENMVSKENFSIFYMELEEISRSLYALINALGKK